MDLIVKNVRRVAAPDEGPVDIAVADGKIAAIGPGLAADGKTYDAGGRLACAGLIETHIHLDKSRIIDRCPLPEGRRVNPVTTVAPLKPVMSVEDVYARAETTLKECLVNGATRMRTQVEIDPGIGLRGFEAISEWTASNPLRPIAGSISTWVRMRVAPLTRHSRKVASARWRTSSTVKSFFKGAVIVTGLTRRPVSGGTRSMMRDLSRWI